MIHLKTFEKNYTIELVQRLFRGLYTKVIQNRTIEKLGTVTYFVILNLR